MTFYKEGRSGHAQPQSTGSKLQRRHVLFSVSCQQLLLTVRVETAPGFTIAKSTVTSLNINLSVFLVAWLIILLCNGY